MSFSDSIRNYYEQMVAEEIVAQLNAAGREANTDNMADIARVALNRLPPKYIRYEVDMAFYMSPDELVMTRQRVRDGVADAIRFVDAHRRDDDLGNDIA
ncbi:late competence development ComFB family protein [Thalassolituus sp.]|uniref:late competence development ComFB family protein n=1 Tax=Thalassolituus sp. TaxID=2030822 RepID=UPI0035149F50